MQCLNKYFKKAKKNEMEERDYLKRQIDVLGRILGKLLSDLLEKKGNGEIVGGIELTNQILNEELNLTIEKITEIPEEDFVNFLETEKKFTNENLEQLAEIMIVNIESGIDEITKLKLYNKSLILLEHIEKNDKTYSFERHLKIEKIKGIISN